MMNFNSMKSMWNFDMDHAPTGSYLGIVRVYKGKEVTKEEFFPSKIITASKCGKVIVSYWIPKEKRWCMYKKGELPIAWQSYPAHPHDLDILIKEGYDYE